MRPNLSDDWTAVLIFQISDVAIASGSGKGSGSRPRTNTTPLATALKSSHFDFLVPDKFGAVIDTQNW